ncbi:YsnF/AvaK domain-containing protein [Massilia sp. 9096]|uniref:YsnF/AvaK domain-containing protein n=1 Tax=Massilia sp. 9096 TaxID=1500894 RepID=UPI00056CEA8A|nr:YsnF/AvaK domain-containing protein [Massilia sp. 9096]
MQHTLVAVFDNRDSAQNAMDALLSADFSRTNVSISSADTSAGSATHDESVGASVKHFFSNLFGDDHDEHASRYAGAVTQGHHVLTITAQSDAEVDRASGLIEHFNPLDIDERDATSAMDPSVLSTVRTGSSSLGASMQAGVTGSSSYSTGSLSDSTQSGSMQRDMGEQLNDQRSAAIPVVQEELKVGKREVQRGGVRVFSRVIETPVNESVNLREEHVNVERRPVDQPISTTDATAFKEQSIELRETAEEAVVQKSARVVEEVIVGKEVSNREQQINDTVRHTEVQVEQLGDSALNDDTAYRDHFNSTYGASGGSYDEYAPAYSYGSQMRGDARYQGRNWDDVESDLRSDWESRNGSTAGSTWDKMKAAVRQGWDKVAH